MKFATKVFIYVFISTALIICGMAVVTHFWILKYHMERTLLFEKELASLVALKSEDYILRNDRVELYKFYNSIIRLDPYMDYIFAENQADILVHTFEKGVPKGLLALGPLNDSDAIDITPVADHDGQLTYHFRMSLSVPAHIILHFGISDKKIRAELIPLRNLMFVVGLFLLIIVPFGVAMFLSRLVSRPINTLRTGVDRIGGGEWHHRLEMKTGDEIEQLADDINTMAEKIEKLKDGMEGEIADRMKAQGDLEKQTELLNNILNNIPHNVFWKDRQSVYMGCNKAFASDMGFEDPGEIVGKTDFDLPSQEREADFFRQRDSRIMASGRPMYDMEEPVTTANGTEKTVITSMVPLKDQEGRPFGILGIYFDITERKQMEEVIKQSQKMEAIGTLAGGIAHDFNNILGGIIGYTELAMDDIDPNHPANSFLKEVFNFAMRAKELVKQILTFSRKSHEERSPIQLSTIVKEEIKLLRSTLPTSIEIVQSIDENTGKVNADPTQMHQIVMNLCTNAAHAMEENGGILEITLSSKYITGDTLKKYHNISPGLYAMLKVADTGDGIDSRIMHRIFEPFFTTKEKEKGTGMGLAVVHGIIKDHAGDIAVESHIGKGTTFTILLPQVISEREPKEAIQKAIPEVHEHDLYVETIKKKSGR